MRKIYRNTPTLNKINPESLENTRDPAEYGPAVVKAHNDRYKDIFTIDPAKAKLIDVRQNSFKPWLATVVLGEDIFDEKGKIITTKQRSAEITRQEYPAGVITVTRAEGETPYQTWKKVEEAADLEENDLVGLLDLASNAHSAVYKISKLSLNWYGEVRVKFVTA